MIFFSGGKGGKRGKRRFMPFVRCDGERTSVSQEIFRRAVFSRREPPT
jgi:hypothetical protein